MKKNIFKIALSFTLVGIVLSSCSDQTKEILTPFPNDITFNDIKLDRFSYKIPDAPYKAGNSAAGMITINVKKNTDGSFSGFALSNKNWRSYPWTLSPDFAPSSPLTTLQKKTAIDSCIFSVYTTVPNKTETYLIGCVNDDNAFITLDKPSVVEHILVANTTYNYLLTNYGSIYSGTLDDNTQSYLLSGGAVKNIQIPNPSTDFYGRWFLPGPDDKNLIRLKGDEILAQKKAGHVAAEQARANGQPQDAVADSTTAAAGTHKGYVRLTIEGFNGSASTGTVDFLLAVRPNVDEAHPAWDFVMDDWNKVDLTSLGMVNKLVFRMSSSYTDIGGKMLTPPYFCLDGIRLKQ